MRFVSFLSMCALNVRNERIGFAGLHARCSHITHIIYQLRHCSVLVIVINDKTG